MVSLAAAMTELVHGCIDEDVDGSRFDVGATLVTHMEHDCVVVEAELFDRFHPGSLPEVLVYTLVGKYSGELVLEVVRLRYTFDGDVTYDGPEHVSQSDLRAVGFTDQGW